MTVTTEMHDGVALIRLNDGRANALNHEVLQALHAALNEAEANASAVVLAGRPDKLFCAGFDLSVMQTGPEQASELVDAGGELAARIYGFPLSVVIACPGHAMAMGAVLLTSADYRFGAEGDFKIGYNEVQIGLPLPEFLTVLAVDRLNPKYLDRAILHAEIFGPQQAKKVGLLDEVVPADQLESRALDKAKALAGLDTHAFKLSKRRVRGDSIQRILESVQQPAG